MQVNEHLECFSQRPLSVHSKGLPGNCSKVSQPALIGQSQGGFSRRCRARRGLHHLFVSLLPSSTDLLHAFSVPSLLGIGGVRCNKKGDWGVLSSGLWFINLRSFKFQTNGVGLWCTHWGVILKHRTIQIHQSPVFSNCRRIDDVQAQCSQGTRGTKAPKPKVQEVDGQKKCGVFFFRVNYIFVLKQQAGQLLDMALSKNPFVL